VIESGLYRGRLWHRRFDPPHAFERDLLVGLVDVALLDGAEKGALRLVRGWPIGLRGADHLPDPSGRDRSLAERVADRVTPVLGRPPTGEMALVSQPRAFGLTFDPASFIYCFGPDGIEAVVVEVTNTPWGERHAYVLVDGTEMASKTHRFRAEKTLHVSPFFGMDHVYSFDVREPDDQIRLSITNHRQGQRVFQAGMALTRIAPLGTRMTSALLRHAFMPAETLLGIYAHAALLFWKRARFHPHPRKGIPASAPADGATSRGSR
jgi:DUF1365 family protein